MTASVSNCSGTIKVSHEIFQLILIANVTKFNCQSLPASRYVDIKFGPS